jgi:hypothetical protein
MSSSVIVCPNPACAKPLNLPAAVVGQPLACPHCGTGIRVTLGPDGRPTAPTAVASGRVPKLFLVPGFALLILGTAGLFANGYTAAAATFEGKGVPLARLMVDYLRDADAAGKPADANRGKEKDDPRGAFAAVLGTAAGVAADEEVDRARAEAAGPWVGPVSWVFTGMSALMAVGGVSILLGRWYWLGVAGSVAAIFNLGLCCCVPGLVAGLWGILTLAKDEGRRHFMR